MVQIAIKMQPFSVVSFPLRTKPVHFVLGVFWTTGGFDSAYTEALTAIQINT
jgi:hypothetical protein